MKVLVTYKAPGIEKTIEPKNRLSRRQIQFVIGFPLVFLFGLLTNPLLSTAIGFSLGVLIFVIFIPIFLGWIFLVNKYWPLKTQDGTSKKPLRPDIVSSKETKRYHSRSNPTHSRVSRTNL